MSEFKLGNLSVEQGEIKKGILGSINMADGSKVNIPLVIINGKKDGPVLVVLAGVHGPEVSGIAALHKVLNNLNTDDLSGTLVGVPGANPFGIIDGKLPTRYDNKDLAVAFSNPDKTGSITNRVASIVWEAINTADYVMDMHANPFPSIPFVLTNLSACKDNKTKQKLGKIAKAFGVTIINWNRPVGSMKDLCSSRGVPAMTPEMAGNIYYWDDIASVGFKGITNVMKVIDMLEGEVEKQNNVTVVDAEMGELEYVGRVCCNQGGLMRILVKPGQKIQKGETIIEIYNLLGEVVEEVKIPCTGYCWSFTGGQNFSAAVNEGTPLTYVFKHVND